MRLKSLSAVSCCRLHCKRRNQRQLTRQIFLPSLDCVPRSGHLRNQEAAPRSNFRKFHTHLVQRLSDPKPYSLDVGFSERKKYFLTIKSGVKIASAETRLTSALI